MDRRPYVQRGLLVPVFREFLVEEMTITAVWPESRRASPNVNAFCGACFSSPGRRRNETSRSNSRALFAMFGVGFMPGQRVQRRR